MPYRRIPGKASGYFLIATDERGAEITPDPDSPLRPLSEKMIEAVADEQITDVFVWSHGWKGDVKEAFDQYDRWIGAFSASTSDRAAMLSRRPAFKELHVGFHWPSLAWGDEALVSGTSFAPALASPVDAVDALEDFHAKELGDSPAVRAALRKLFNEVRTHAAENTLTDIARQAYLELDDALGLGDSGLPGDGGTDRMKFDPDQAVDGQDDTAFAGGTLAGKLLAPLRQLTFWTMKKRAKTVGEQGLHPLLARMQAAFPSLRLHLMGHSFGCIVMSSAIGGPKAGGTLPRSIDSCVLVQGATSVWAFGPSNPYQSNVPGYFSKIITGKKIAGPLVATLSKYDYALGRFYPWAAGVANQIAFGVPQFGALGTYGISGIPEAVSLPMKPESEAYRLVPGGLYNVDGSRYICNIDGVSGAHSDIGGPEVAHLIWQAAMPAGDAE